MSRDRSASFDTLLLAVTRYKCNDMYVGFPALLPYVDAGRMNHNWRDKRSKVLQCLVNYHVTDERSYVAIVHVQVETLC